jgi:hypothetical protein
MDRRPILRLQSWNRRITLFQLVKCRPRGNSRVGRRTERRTVGQRRVLANGPRSLLDAAGLASLYARFQVLAVAGVKLKRLSELT